MSTYGTPHEIHALSGAYAVDALDDVERARFEDHLAACAECRAEVASLQVAAASFSALTTTEPPAALRDSVLAEIKTVRPLPPVLAQARARRPRWVDLAAAAAVLAAVGGGFTAWQQTHDETTQAPPSAVQAIRSAADVTTVTKDLGGGASATIYRSASLGKAALVTSHLPAAPAGKVYQLWLRDARGQMTSAGLLTGSGRREVVLHGDATDATAAGISVEPDGGSTSPTIPVLALIDFEQAT